jgi:hypothetical protein
MVKNCTLSHFCLWFFEENEDLPQDGLCLDRKETATGSFVLILLSPLPCFCWQALKRNIQGISLTLPPSAGAPAFSL